VAVSLTLIYSTPHRLRYLATADGAGEGFLSASAIERDGARGALRATLCSVLESDAAAVALTWENPHVRLVPLGQRNLEARWAFDARCLDGRWALVAKCDREDNLGVYFEIQFIHSTGG
jgi:hypothetical protein